MRRCIGCMQSREKQQLIRIAGYEGVLTVDVSGRAKGRGVYLCRDNPDCWQQAQKRRALERSFHMPVTEQMKEEIFMRLEELAHGK
ncbi:MAG: YlxR family protein [Firmicutes bacterium]|nr:YlxR family protein [Bacillota bacterium]